MYRVTLINMPFASPQAPSLALTQLEAMLAAELPGRVACRTAYVNQDFARHLGLETYHRLVGGLHSLGTGLGEWLFRASAFPDLPDNAEDYFQRYYLSPDEETAALKATILEQRQRLDAYLDGVIDALALDQADLVGFTSMFSQTLASVALARKLKARSRASGREIVTVLGGANCESPMGEGYARNLDVIDFVFSGPALRSFPAFVRHRIEGDEEACHEIRGVLSKRNCAGPSNGPGRSTDPGASLGEELDIDVPVPLDFSQFFASLDRSLPRAQQSPVLHFETSRGCWWGARAHCTFCGLNGGTIQYRSMSPARAIAQFEALFEWTDRPIQLNSVDNILPENYPTEVFPALDPPENVSIFYEVKASLSEESFASLARARVRAVQPGIEALATSTLKLMRKGTSAFQNVAFLKNCLRYDILPEWNLLIGFPGEEEDVFRKYLDDIPRLLHLPPPSGAHAVRFDRYSPYFVSAEEYDLQLEPYDYYALTYPFAASDLADIAYYFVDRNYGAPYVRAQAKWIAKVQQAVADWVARWAPGGEARAPELYFTADAGTQGLGSCVLADSRGGILETRGIDALEARILHALDEMKTVPKLAALLPDVPPSEVDGALDSLDKQGLVFEERRRFISLVLPGPTRAWFAPEAAQAERSRASSEPADSGAPALVRLPRNRRRPGRPTRRAGSGPTGEK